MNHIDLKELNIQPFGQLHHDYIGYQSLTDIPKVLAYSEAECDFSHLSKGKSTANLVEFLRCTEALLGQAQLLGIIQRRESPDYMIDGRTGTQLKVKKNFMHF
jgi:phosphorylase kinase alpha/beta subunit